MLSNSAGAEEVEFTYSEDLVTDDGTAKKYGKGWYVVEEAVIADDSAPPADPRREARTVWFVKDGKMVILTQRTNHPELLKNNPVLDEPLITVEQVLQVLDTVI
ncbi:hypothetical protein [Aestuariimicrobium ganziense]|uniref:hypothetical protein n=1 Tax=Aestuariimicrobium ganziense TaxID=2773677 RepID=UPI0019426D35|nr:hypothetical protein [Aestuariimicrobium ganziense]